MPEIIYFFGRFHVLALHLPIGIILAAVALEWIARRRRYAHLASAAPMLWAAAAVTAILTVVLGYMHFAEGAFSGPSANAHRLYGTSVAVVAAAIWLLCAKWPAVYRRIHLAAGLLLVALVTLTGHYGGALTHGSTYLVEYAPDAVRALVGAGARRPQVANLAMADPYYDVVRPLLQARCSTCHSEDKRESGLSMATYAATLAGGETGSVLVRGNSAMSELYRRVSLPQTHEEFMPAEGKTPLTANQVAILRWWIDAGAPVDITLEELGVTPDVELMLAAELNLTESAQSAAAAGPITADPQIVAGLYEAGFLSRQVSQSDSRLIVSVYSPGKPLESEQLAALLSAADGIGELDLRNAGIDDGDLAEFARFTQLTRLRLNGNQVSDQGVEIVARLPTLQYLNLYANEAVTDAALDALAGMPALEELYVWQTGVSAEGAARLRAQRPNLVIQAGTAASLDLPTGGRN